MLSYGIPCFHLDQSGMFRLPMAAELDRPTLARSERGDGGDPPGHLRWVLGVPGRVCTFGTVRGTCRLLLIRIERNVVVFELMMMVADAARLLFRPTIHQD